MTISDRRRWFVFVAARMHSVRLPGKTLADVHGRPLLARLIERLAMAIPRDRIVVCTSVAVGDDAVASCARTCGVAAFRGDAADVAGRFIEAAKACRAGTVVRVTGDNPLTDPGMIRLLVARHLRHGAEYSYTDDLPAGTCAEVIDVSALVRIHGQLVNPSHSEYMTFMLKRPDKLRVLRVAAPDARLCRPTLALTVDTPSDLALIRDIYEHFDGDVPELPSVIAWLDSTPRHAARAAWLPGGPPPGVDCCYRDDPRLEE